MRIGVLGGTFDPIHLAHLLIAEEARVRLGLEEVVFIPTGQPWMKAHTPVSPAHDRLTMVRLATASNPFFRVAAMEVDRPGPSYTVDTLAALRTEYGPEAVMFFILGVDSAHEFHRWKEPERILELATLAVVTRPGTEDFNAASLSKLYECAPQRVATMEGVAIDISGRELRRRVAKGESIRYWVCGEVAKYIYDHGLYRDESSGA